MVDEAMGEGFVVAAHFAEQLPVYEKQELAMRMYFPDLISTIDLRREEERLNKLEFAAARPTRKAKPAAAPPPPELTPGEKAWEEAEDFYYKRDLVKAREAYGKVIDATTEKPLQGKAYYGLARIAMLNKDPESAEKLFAKSLELEPPAPEKSWVLYYLGRLSEASGEPDAALARFRAAVALEGGSPKAREAAAKALEQSGKK
jgi:tetratricopeptide (TPR) repeat protein